MTFVDCAEDIKAGSNINYDGPAGTVTLGTNGDVTAADFELFAFDDTGRDYQQANSARGQLDRADQFLDGRHHAGVERPELGVHR